MPGQDLCRRAGDDRSREGRAGEPHVARARPGSRAWPRAAWRSQAPARPCSARQPRSRASGSRPSCSRRPTSSATSCLLALIEPSRSTAPTVITNGSLPGAYGTPLGPFGMAVVARCHDDRDAAEPQLLDRLVERVLREVARRRRVEREVRDLDVVLGAVLVDPLGRGDDVARARHAVVVHDVERRRGSPVEPRRRSRGAARRDARDERAVTAAVARRSSAGAVVIRTCRCDDAVAPLSKSGRFLSMPESTIAIVGMFADELGLVHNGRTPDAVGQTWFDVGVTPSSSFDVARDRQAGDPRELEDLLRLQRDGDRAHELELVLEPLPIVACVVLACQHPRTRLAAVVAPRLLWMITLTYAFGVMFAFASQHRIDVRSRSGTERRLPDP